jgi:hypothetical protein
MTLLQLSYATPLACFATYDALLAQHRGRLPTPHFVVVVLELADARAVRTGGHGQSPASITALIVDAPFNISALRHVGLHASRSGLAAMRVGLAACARHRQIRVLEVDDHEDGGDLPLLDFLRDVPAVGNMRRVWLPTAGHVAVGRMPLLRSVGLYGGCATLAVLDLTAHRRLRRIGEDFCNFASALTRVLLPDTVRAIGGYFLASCEALAEVRMSSALRTLGPCAFMGSALPSIDVSRCADLAALPSEFGKCCPYLTQALLPDGLEAIGDEVLVKCVSLTLLSPLGGSLRRIGASFLSYSAVRELDMTRCHALADVGRNLGLVSKLQSVAFPERSTAPVRVGDGCLTHLTTLRRVAFGAAGVTRFADGAFRGAMVTALDLSRCDRLMWIDGGFATQCRQLRTVAFPDALEVLGSGALRRCPLRRVTFGAGLRIVGDNCLTGASDAVVDMARCAQLQSVGENFGAGAARVTFPPHYTGTRRFSDKLHTMLTT